MVFDVLLIDEDLDDSKRYEKLLSDGERIQVRSIPPTEDIDDNSLSPIPDLILLDYLLTKRQSSGVIASYRGGTLATYISEHLPEVPLVLFSTKSILGENPAYEDEIQVLDWILYKDDIIKDPEYGRKFLYELIIGFSTLRSIKDPDRTWDSLKTVITPNLFEEENLQRSSPPKGALGGQWRVHRIVKWILRVLFEYPGIFYDSLYAASALGINVDSFYKKEVQEYFKDSLYSGIFSGIKNLWWKDRIQEIGFNCIREEGLEPRLSDNFRLAFTKKTSIKLEPSICVFSGEENANTVCYILKKPVKMKHTLGYLPDDRPESMEQARISYKAIREADYKVELIPLVDKEQLEFLREINP